MRNLRTAAAILLGLAALSACTPPEQRAFAQATGTARRPAQTIFISMDYDTPFDARVGDTVNVIMDPDASDLQGYCDRRGGSLWMNPYTDILICESIDF